MPWASRWLRNGVLTTRYPRQADGYDPTYHGAIDLTDPAAAPSANGKDAAAGGDLQQLCPTGAIRAAGGTVSVDRGSCILCGQCVTARPDLFSFIPDIELATFDRSTLVVSSAGGDADPDLIQQARAELAKKVKALRRSVHIRHVDAGSDGAEEWEIAALNNPVYDIQRLGVFFTASPRHADLLLVTGAGTAGMAGPLRRTWEAMPDPKLVIAAGTDAISGGLFAASYATRGGISTIVPVDVWVPGSPPNPFSLVHAIITAVGMLPRGRGR